MSSCPGDSTLGRLGSDSVGDATYAAIEGHIEGCPDCLEALERLAAVDDEHSDVLPTADRWPRIPGFAIERELGRGASGVVYLATQTDLHRRVALKVLTRALDQRARPAARRRWLWEARAISRVRHPNVASLHDYGEAEGWFYLVLEFIPGGTLKERLAASVSPPVAAGLAETIARAVGSIHGSGLLHLDLKPSNILLDGEVGDSWSRVVPRVSDFGLALFDDPDASITSLAGPRGTPSYMAPEQVIGSSGRIGPAADIYAIGAILYALLTGRPPFQGASAIETLDRVRNRDPVPPRRIDGAIPRDLQTICLACLQKDPVRRYATADALADDLR
jgi:serine/threonine protein kinase